MPSHRFSVVLWSFKTRAERVNRASICVRGEEPRAPPPPPKPTSCVVQKTLVLPPPPLLSAQSEAEGPVCLQIPLLLPSLSLSLCLPHPRIYHTLVLSLTPSTRDSWLLLMSFKLNAKRVWKLFIWKFYIWKVLILDLSDILMCFCLNFTFFYIEIHERLFLLVSFGLTCSLKILYTS